MYCKTACDHIKGAILDSGIIWQYFQVIGRGLVILLAINQIWSQNSRHISDWNLVDSRQLQPEMPNILRITETQALGFASGAAALKQRKLERIRTLKVWIATARGRMATTSGLSPI